MRGDDDGRTGVAVGGGGKEEVRSSRAGGHMPVIPALWRLRQEDHELKARLSYRGSARILGGGREETREERKSDMRSQCESFSLLGSIFFCRGN